MTDTGGTNHNEHHGHEPEKGYKRWLFSTNHKDIGTMYLFFAFAMLFVGGAMSFVIRAELFQPGLQFINPDFFNQMITLHALIMVFGMIMPAFAGFANWMIPLMIGAPDMALPRLNNLSFWILPFAGIMLLSTLFMAGGAPATQSADRQWISIRDVFRALVGDLIDSRFDQYHRHDSEYARARYDVNDDAPVRLDLVDHSLSPDRRNAGTGRRNYDAFNRPVFWHQFFQCRWRW